MSSARPARVWRGRRRTRWRVVEQPHIRHTWSRVATKSFIALGGRYAGLVVSTSVPVGASSSALPTSSGTVDSRADTVSAVTQPTPGSSHPDSAAEIENEPSCPPPTATSRPSSTTSARSRSASGPVTTGRPMVTFAVTSTPLSMRSTNASARAWSTVSDGSSSTYVAPRLVIADHAAADAAAGQLRPPGGGAVGAGGDLHAPVAAVPALGGADLVGGDPRRDPAGHRRDAAGSRLGSRSSSTDSTAAHASTVEAVAPGHDLLHHGAAEVALDDPTQQPREPLGQRGGQRHPPPGRPLTGPGRQRHLGRCHRVDEPQPVVHLAPAHGRSAASRARRRGRWRPAALPRRR